MSEENVAPAVSDIKPPSLKHKTCEICGEEDLADGTGIWAVLNQGNSAETWVHRGPCFLEYGLLQNAATPTYRTALERLTGLMRARADSWKAVALGAKASAEELALLRKLPEIVESLLLYETSSYCEFCRQHAPKVFPGGTLLGPVPHLADCPAEAAHEVLAAIERIRERSFIIAMAEPES